MIKTLVLTVIIFGLSIGAVYATRPQIEPTLTATPSAINTPTPQHVSDGLSSCPECTMAPAPVVPTGAPDTGRGK